MAQPSYPARVDRAICGSPLCAGTNDDMTSSPDKYSLHLARAETAFKINRFDVAAKHFKKAIACRPESAPAHTGLAKALFLFDRDKEALPAIREALRLAPMDYDTHYWAIYILLQLSGFKAVVESGRMLGSQ